jgi:aspartyl-tRNA(Asn)/glutamyl-tRNA(Gln) amidotransferase subunit A
MPEALRGLDAARAAELLRRREISSVELTRACLEAIDASRATVNAFISTWPEEALASAERADREIAAGRVRGPLHGIPLAWKDVLFRKGMVTTVGSRICRELRSEVTATVVGRLAEAGAVFAGALNLSEMIMSPTGRNEHYGDCRNPWNTRHIAGGSSSGSGAALAARLVPLALGSDTGGSIRIPAALCGVTGLKPTYGLVSRFGCFPRAWSLDVLGPMARSVADCAALTSAMAGHDERDPTTARLPPPLFSPDDVDLRPARIAVPYERHAFALEPSVKAALDESVRQLASAGATIVPVELPSFERYYTPANVINKVEGSAIHGHWLRTRREDYSRAVITRLEAGYCIPATHYLDALRSRSALLREFVGSALKDADALHFPVVGIGAPSLEEAGREDAERQPEFLHTMTGFTRWVNYLGLPALSLPCGFTSEKLPVGFQLVGRPFSEKKLFRIGHAYQRATDWHRRAPARGRGQENGLAP